MSSEDTDKTARAINGRGKSRRLRPTNRTPAETERDQDLYLEVLSRTGAVIRSAEEVPGLTYNVVSNWREKDPAFRERMNEAKARFGERLEAEALRRGALGVEEPVFYRGRQVATVKKYSDRLLELILKKANPEYREHITADVNVRGGVLIVPGVATSVADWAAAHEAEIIDPAGELPAPGEEDCEDGASRG